MNAVEVMRMAAARREATRQYATAYDRHAEAEQVHRLAEEIAAAEIEHQRARICLVAYLRETDDRTPEGLPK